MSAILQRKIDTHPVSVHEHTDVLPSLPKYYETYSLFAVVYLALFFLCFLFALLACVFYIHNENMLYSIAHRPGRCESDE